MSYNYQNEKSEFFTENQQKRFIKFRDKVKYLLNEAGAFRMDRVMGEMGSSFQDLAALDYMIELGEIVKLERDGWAQYQVYTTPEVTNR
jgi:hypothetical protein